jgi:hypothetical protein
MSILAGEARTFSLNPSRVTLTAPEDCECERQDENHVIITLASLPECKVHLDIVRYDQRFDPSPTVPHDNNRRALDFLRDDIYHKFNFDPNSVYPQYSNRLEFDGWFRMWWRNQENTGMDVWLHRYDSYMFRVMAAKLTEEESTHIRSLVENLVVEI